MRRNIKISQSNFHKYYVKSQKEFDELAFNKFLSLTRGNRNKLVFLPTGKTPLGFYQQIIEYSLINKGFIKKFFFINLDEYLGISQSSEHSFKKYLENNLVNPLKLTSKQYYWIDNKKPIHKETTYLDSLIKKYKSIDLCILGVGENGHIAFNEPNCNPNLDFYDTSLKKSTLKNITFNKKLITHGRTIGISKILSSKKILLLVSGKNKKSSLKKLLSKKIDTNYPVSYLSSHSNVTIIIKE